MTGPWPRILPCGDTAIAVEFGEAIDEDVNRRVIGLERMIENQALPGVVETVPTYRSLLVHLDPLTADHAGLTKTLARLAEAATPQAGCRRRWRVPVVYGGEFGEDLARLAELHGMGEERFAELHSRAVYRVHMVGFVPGFTYLGGLDPRLATPRRKTPRQRIPAGSISIGGHQTAIGSIEAPSGWHLIGRTPVRCFHPDRDPIFLFRAGDEVCMEPIQADAWDELAALATAGDMVAACETA